MQDADRVRDTKQRGKEVAAGRLGVVKVHALPGEEQRPVEAGIDQCLRPEALRHGGGRISPRLAPLLQRKRGGQGRQREQRDGDDEQSAKSPIGPSFTARLTHRRGLALVQEVPLQLIQVRRVLSRPVESAGEAGAAIERTRVAAAGLPLRGRQCQVPVLEAPLNVRLQPVDEPLPPFE